MSLLNPIGGARHIDKISLVAKAIYEGGAKSFVLNYFFPTGEWEIGCCDGGLFSGSERKMIEYLLSTFFVKTHITELVAYNKVIGEKTMLEFS